MLRLRPIIGKRSTTVFREPELPTGYPDLVAVSTRRSRIKARRRLALAAPHFRVLHHLHLVGKRRREDLSRELLVPIKQLNTLLSDLKKGRMVVEVHDGFAAKPLNRIFATTRIVAVEAKVSEWRAAMTQAVANRWFASESYLLIPKNRNIRTVVQEARLNKVGLMIWDTNSCKIVVRAPKQRLPISFGSWILNEWVLNKHGDRPWS